MYCKNLSADSFRLARQNSKWIFCEVRCAQKKRPTAVFRSPFFSPSQPIAYFLKCRRDKEFRSFLSPDRPNSFCFSGKAATRESIWMRKESQPRGIATKYDSAYIWNNSQIHLFLYIVLGAYFCLFFNFARENGFCQ